MSKIDFPSTLEGWEMVLVDRFLRIGPDGDSSPVRSFEITPDTLASASGVADANPADAETAFRAAICSDLCWVHALRTGYRRASTIALPHCFTYLAMTLLISTLLDGDHSDQGQFRERLRDWLGSTRSMMNLAGVAIMWRSLQAWLDTRIAAGEPYRRLVLPPPRSWTQIGYSRRLSFPTRADLRFLRQAMARSRCAPLDPPQLIRAIGAAIERGGASWGMEAAFHEFRDAFRASAASTDHRFWRLVKRAVKSATPVERKEASIELRFDQDARRSFLLGSADRDVELDVVADLGTAMRSDFVLRSANLSVAAARGILFFRQIGTARWQGQSEPPAGATVTHIALSGALLLPAQGAMISLEKSGEWYITTAPLGHRTVDSLLSRLQLTRIRDKRLLDVALVGGVVSSGAFLGRPNFLPRIEAGDRHATVTRLPGQILGAEVTVCDGALASLGNVDGTYDVSVTVDVNGDLPGWSRRVRFVADAVPHINLSGVAYQEPLVSEWLAVDSHKEPTVVSNTLSWSDDKAVASDLLEAIYAAGRTGMSEAELVDLMAHAADAQTGIWHLLRSIQESGFIEARHRSQWRGRVWTLGEPTLTVLNNDVRPLFLVEGAVCAALEREFREVVERMGGTPFRRLNTATWSPPVIGAIGVEIQALSTRLGWKVMTQPPWPRLWPGALETSSLVGEYHVLASKWDWSQRRFIADARAPQQPMVSLTRWVHPGGRDHDIYRVNSAGHMSSHMTRNGAILAAHIAARVALFRVDGSMLVVTSKEGALPLEFARWLRRSALVGGGPSKENGYGYAFGTVDLSTIARALPACIEGVQERIIQRSNADMLMSSRRSRGRVRALWADGMITVTQ